jgi:5-methylcytosine-specific restriction protein A
VTAKPCSHPGCREVITGRDRYCASHAAQHQQPSNWSRVASVDHRHHSARWTAKSRAYRSRHPLCEDCLELGIVRPADLVDHVHELRDGGQLLDDSNLRSLCRKHHAKKSMKARAGRAG